MGLTVCSPDPKDIYTTSPDNQLLYNMVAIGIDPQARDKRGLYGCPSS